MPSQDCLQVYEILREITGDDDIFKIIEADEVLQKLPAKTVLTKVQLSAIIRDLKDEDYITVKYFTPDEYCLLTKKRITESAPAPVQPEAQDAAVAEGDVKARLSYDSKKKKTDAAVKTIKSATVFFMSFLGALLGSGIVAAIVVIVLKFVK